MTDKEKAIVMAHTGICMLTGNKFQIFHKYVEDIMNRPVMTHEIGQLADEIKEKSKADFMALCANESSSENPNNSTTKNDLEVDLISRNEVLNRLASIAKIKAKSDAQKSLMGRCMFMVERMPSVTPQEPKTGHWNDIPKYKDIAWNCSECEHLTTMKHNYCPNCGADMREVEE